LVSPAAKQGDLICIFPPARVPSIVREVVGTDAYVLVGDCYAQGIMDGEEMEDMKNESLVEHVLI
jgi:hypothetical protein